MFRYLLVFSFFIFSCGRDTIERPNILFIAIDDLNDWSEPLGGNNKEFTPYLESFSEESVNFTKNY